MVTGKFVLRACDAQIVIADTIANIRRASRGWPSNSKVAIDLQFQGGHIPANGRSNRRRSVSRSLVVILSLTRRASSIAPETSTA